MVTENECKQSLKKLENINLDIVLDELGYEKAEEISIYGINDYPTLEKQGDIEVLRELIKEHYENPPLKFEELKEDMWVWDNENKQMIKIYDTYILLSGTKVIRFNWGFEYYNGKFEPNRFYRKEVKNDDKILEERMKTYKE